MKLCEILQRPEIPERPSDFHLVAGVAEKDLLFPGNFHFGVKLETKPLLRSKMAAINREFLSQANLFLLIALTRSRSRKIKRKKHRFWVREIFKLGEKLGAYYTLVQEMRLQDRQYFYR